MYTYIVERTQIYLSSAQASALNREAKRTGVTRSHLIREAIEERYGLAADRERLRAALRETAGLWKDRKESGEAYVERMRKSDRLRRLYPHGFPDDSPAD
jgi:regulator of replication initiation timing